MQLKWLRSRTQSVFLALVVLMMAVILVQYPEQAFTSSLRGLKIWWDVIFPTLLPFFVIAEMMIGFGVVHFVGILLEPLMRPIFRVPGAGAFVMAVGFISGNPMGAKLTSRLREQKLVTREEGERLLSFTSTASPLFIFGAVAVGFFEEPRIGLLLAIAHYISSILVGICMRFYRTDAPSTPPIPTNKEFLILRALRAMHRARIQDGRNFGQLLGEAVTSAVHTLLMIGGFIMVFSVFIHLIHFLEFQQWGSLLIEKIFAIVQLTPALSEPFFAGLVEMTLGSQMISDTPPTIPLISKLVAVSMIIGWNGFSIHAQIASIISRTNLRYWPYFLGKLLHAIFAGIITFLLWKILQPSLQPIALHISTFSLSRTTTHLPHYWEIWQHICTWIAIIWLMIRTKQLFKPAISAGEPLQR
ncbi:sporulation integral membrane protein YlbJ [Seinonella peptonophila]|uniref:Sporulation integral membrane protein YlbJ n=1 Tax=Seinonella peptonophila TaxID=112248 RepID=A0A1M4UU84_9BACL|nr:sporulation integral membrane protein YlbJ [Seinonella peptonophila]SHE60272.1 sporulation integral membrane protein YlbJ [Seinonella peptonophila]